MIGETLGNFVLESRLGRGGMGEVYLAKHRELGTLVAVKLLNENISEDHDQVQRFFNEARIVSKIRHAGTIKIFDSGFVSGHAYLVMELLEGESLATRLRRTIGLPVAQVVDISRQIASVLDATHRAGVTHRDLKPDNIFVIGDDERATGERVKVLDFGIAKLSGTLANLSPQTVGTMGTPAYMAPEQWKDTSLVDWRADAYALGCVMFEMATGRPPFLAQSIPEAYTMHAEEIPPSTRALQPRIPVELDALIARLLAKAPEARAASMAELGRELEVIGATLPRSSPAFGDAVAATMAAPRPGAAAPSIERPAAGTPGVPAVLSATTLGATAAEIQSRPTPRGSRGWVVIGAAVAAAIATVIAVLATRSSGPAATVDSPPPTTGPAQTDVQPALRASPAEAPQAPATRVMPSPPSATTPTTGTRSPTSAAPPAGMPPSTAGESPPRTAKEPTVRTTKIKGKHPDAVGTGMGSGTVGGSSTNGNGNGSSNGNGTGTSTGNGNGNGTSTGNGNGNGSGSSTGAGSGTGSSTGHHGAGSGIRNTGSGSAATDPAHPVPPPPEDELGGRR